VGACRKKRYSYNTLVGKPPGKIVQGRPKRRCRNTIQIKIREIVCDDVARFDARFVGLVK
jgi:hypothetical protein